MTHGNEFGLRLPSYARRVDVPGGTLKRWWLHGMLRLIARRTSFIDADIDAMRAYQDKWDRRFGVSDGRQVYTPVRAAGFAGGWLDLPESRPSRVILYLHGGAFLFRWPRIHAHMVESWCQRLQARALMVDYRLAPEFPFPVAADDCLDAYRWLRQQGHPAREIVIAGDSAGANLALVTLQRLSARAETPPACAVLLSPGVDFTLSSRSLLTNGSRDPMFSLAGLVALRGYYAQPERYTDPGVSPLFGDFNGLPPLLFQVGGREVLLDESTRAAERAHAAGIPVELEIWERLGHVFQALPLPQAAAAADHIARFVATHTGWPIGPPLSA